MMRGHGDICLLCRHSLNLPSSTNSAKRFASARQREPYVLPRLVIDLDAADSKYVRKAEKLEEWHPKSFKKPAASPRSEPIERPQSTERQETSLHLRISQVTPPDLLAFALLGDPGGPWNWKTQYLRNIFRYQRIEADDGIHAKALQLSSDFKHDPVEQLELKKDFPKGYVWQLATSANRGGFPEVARMVSILSSTKEGCLFLAEAGYILLNAIRFCRAMQKHDRPQSSVSSDMVLRLLNNLRINMDSKGVKLGPKLCYSGLYYAAMDWNLPSLRTYLEILPENNFEPHDSHNIWSTPFRALEVMMRRLLYEPERAAGSLGSETLKLITGWDSCTTPVTYTRRAASIMYCLHKSPFHPICPSYLAGLAELKLSDTLLAEWQADSKNAIGTLVWKQNSRLRAQIFALAFQLAGDTSHALSILHSALDVEPDKPSSEASDNTTELPSQDAPHHVRVLLSFFKAHYMYHNVQPTKALQKMLEQALGDMPTDPRQFLDMFEKFLVRDYRAPIQLGQPPKKLSWVDGNGLQGLLIHPDEGDVPIYWKSASQAVV